MRAISFRMFVGGAALAVSIGSAGASPSGLTLQNLVPTSREAPSEYGVDSYGVTTLPAVAFTAQSSDTSYVPPYYTSVTDMSRFFLMDDGIAEIYAPVSVPAGAVIDYVGLDTLDVQGGLIGMSLNRVDSTGAVTQVAAFSNTAHEFAMDFNASPIGYQVYTNAGQQLVLNVEFAAGVGIPRFGFAEIRWRRTVSPAPLLPSFTDVPTTHPFYQFIEALHHSGITGGCGGGAFCPEAPLTRGQMAVFLARALGLNW